ncbi:MAG: DNA internalization-related competence protein ComEC/Rec2 [Eubacteriales bacterium]|nr:DNA internalization-related competence protein ComEC/Rec2 [Eubacteriales bacterium]MDD4389647.1 DNA internalization-related competence protein ComEC/Rec2 [Eubacteriales bacterium]
MRRPIVPVAGAFSLGIWLAHTYEIISLSVWIVAAVVFVLLTGLVYSFKKISGDRAKILFFAGLFCFVTTVGGIAFTFERTDTSEIIASVGEYIEVSVVVQNAYYSEAKKRIALIAKMDGGEKILINVYGELNDNLKKELKCVEDLAGKRIKVSGVPELPQERRNPKTFDYRLYLKTKGIDTIISISSIQIEKVESECQGMTMKILNTLSVFKADFSNALAEIVGKDTAYLTMGMLFGETENIDEDIEEAFRKNGTSHILSVSGLHVALVYVCFQKATRGRKSAITSALTLILLFIYAAASLFSPSVVRAVAMIGMHIFATRLHLSYDVMCAAAATAVAAMVYQPYILFNAGFQLSYLAIFSLAVIMKAMKKHYKGIFLSGIAIQVGMLPATAYLFNYFSLVSILANLPVIFISGFIIPAGLMQMILFACGADQLFGIFAVLIKLMNDAMILSNDIFYNEGMYALSNVSPPIFILIIYFAVVFLGLSESAIIAYKRRQVKKIALVTVAVIISAGFIHCASASGFEKAELIFVDIGQGDCLHIKSDNGKNILIDGGGSVNYDVGEKVLMPYLLKNGVKSIDYAFVTHLHTDHYAGICSLAKNGMIKKLFLSEANKLNEAKTLYETGLEKKDIEYMSEGMKIQIGNDTKIEAIWPPKANREAYENILASEDENEFSLVMRVTKNGLGVLMTGDIDSKGEQNLIESPRNKINATILKSAHHGSRYSNSDEFIEAVNPQMLVIQVGKNNYGHPDKTLIEKCLKKGIMVYRNDKDGAIGIKNIKKGRGNVVTVL